MPRDSRDVGTGVKMNLREDKEAHTFSESKSSHMRCVVSALSTLVYSPPLLSTICLTTSL